MVWIYTTHENFNKEKKKTIDIIESMNISMQQNSKPDGRHIKMNNKKGKTIAQKSISDNQKGSLLSQVAM
jgi:hypothetical protein